MCFRGYAVSNLDWATDFDSYMREVKNPMKMHSSQQPTMKIHSKLHDLLYAEACIKPHGGGGSSTNSSRGGEVWTEFMDMLQNKIRPITNNYPGYKVSRHRVTSWSLFAFKWFLTLVICPILALCYWTQLCRSNCNLVCFLSCSRARCYHPKTSHLRLHSLTICGRRIISDGAPDVGGTREVTTSTRKQSQGCCDGFSQSFLPMGLLRLQRRWRGSCGIPVQACWYEPEIVPKPRETKRRGGGAIATTSITSIGTAFIRNFLPESSLWILHWKLLG